MIYRTMFALLLLALLSACATGPRVYTSTAPGVDLSSYQRFAFVEPLGTDRAGYASIISQQLTFSTRRELELRGLAFVEDAEQADLLVNFLGHLDEQIRTRQVTDPFYGPSFYDFRYGYYNPWPAYSISTEVQQYSEGTLVIDLIDAQTQQMVWEGTARNEVTERTRREAASRLDAAVKRIFEDFPLRVSAAN
ncbi:MAG: DUF4136 domain-containing protein [Wenzhouxiangella sp.]|jgi:hypothetical protein|nr:DUF4136 domain-containing protein [Wenzhouxiangella sp.]